MANVNYTLNNGSYPIVNSSWTIPVTRIFSENSTGNRTEFTGIDANASYAHFDINSDSISFPSKLYNNITATLNKVVGNLTCNVTGCWAKDLCSNIASRVPNLNFGFGTFV